MVYGHYQVMAVPHSSGQMLYNFGFGGRLRLSHFYPGRLEACFETILFFYSKTTWAAKIFKLTREIWCPSASVTEKVSHLGLYLTNYI